MNCCMTLSPRGYACSLVEHHEGEHIAQLSSLQVCDRWDGGNSGRLDDDRESLIAERNALTAERDALTAENARLRAQVAAVEALLPGRYVLYDDRYVSDVALRAALAPRPPDQHDEPDPLAHLRADAPFLVCSDCKRRSWDDVMLGRACLLTQPDGGRCAGHFVNPAGADQ